MVKYENCSVGKHRSNKLLKLSKNLIELRVHPSKGARPTENSDLTQHI